MVIGCGGVGLNAVQGAVLAGADRIIAVDLLDNKLEYAREFGATDVVNAGNGDAVARVVEMTGGGVDYVFEAIGNTRTIEQGYEMCRPGGTLVVVGMAPETGRLQGERALAAAHGGRRSSARGTARRARGWICRSSPRST